MCFETVDGKRVSIHDCSKVFVATASYENGYSFLRNVFPHKNNALQLFKYYNSYLLWLFFNLHLKSEETPVIINKDAALLK